MRGLLLLVVLAPALAVRLWVLRSLRFDGLYGQDAFAYYYHGLELWQAHVLTYPWPWLHAPLPLFFPLGEPALLAAIFALIGRATPAAALAASLACGLAAVALVYLLALRAANGATPADRAGWVAALAATPIALGGLQVQAASTIMSDSPSLFWGLAALWLWTTPLRRGCDAVEPSGHEPVPESAVSAIGVPYPLRAVSVPPYLRGERTPSLPQLQVRVTCAFAAGICLALAVSTRWEYGLLLPAVAAAVLMEQGLHRVRILPALIGLLLAGLPQLLYSLHYSDPVLHHQWLTGWSPAHLWQASFTTVDGVQHYPVSVGAFYLIRPLVSPQSLPAPMVPFLPLGIIALARRGTTSRTARSWLAVLLCWWLVPAFYLAGVPYESARFTLIYLPPLAILEAIGFIAALGALAAWFRRRGGRSAARACVLLGALWTTIGLGILAAEARNGVEALARGKEGDLAAVGWLQVYAPPGAAIATFGLTLMLYHYGDPAAHRWTLLDLSAANGDDLARVARNPTLLVVVNTGNLAAQWRGLPPETAYAWLRTHAHLRRVAQVGGYTVFDRS